MSSAILTLSRSWYSRRWRDISPLVLRRAASSCWIVSCTQFQNEIWVHNLERAYKGGSPGLHVLWGPKDFSFLSLFFNFYKGVFCKHCTLCKTHKQISCELYSFLGTFMNTNNIQVFQNYEIMVDFFGNNMELLAGGRIRSFMHQFIPADMSDCVLMDCNWH